MYEKEDILKQADSVSNKIKGLELIKQYQNVEQQIHENSSIDQNETIKIATKQSVNFQNYGKHQLIKNLKRNSQLEKKSMHYLLLKSFGQRNLKQMSCCN